MNSNLVLTLKGFASSNTVFSPRYGYGYGSESGLGWQSRMDATKTGDTDDDDNDDDYYNHDCADPYVADLQEQKLSCEDPLRELALVNGQTKFTSAESYALVLSPVQDDGNIDDAGNGTIDDAGNGTIDDAGNGTSADSSMYDNVDVDNKEKKGEKDKDVLRIEQGYGPRGSTALSAAQRRSSTSDMPSNVSKLSQSAVASAVARRSSTSEVSMKPSAPAAAPVVVFDSIVVPAAVTTQHKLLSSAAPKHSRSPSLPTSNTGSPMPIEAGLDSTDILVDSTDVSKQAQVQTVGTPSRQRARSMITASAGSDLAGHVAKQRSMSTSGGPSLAMLQVPVSRQQLAEDDLSVEDAAIAIATGSGAESSAEDEEEVEIGPVDERTRGRDADTSQLASAPAPVNRSIANRLIVNRSVSFASQPVIGDRSSVSQLASASSVSTRGGSGAGGSSSGGGGSGGGSSSSSSSSSGGGSSGGGGRSSSRSSSSSSSSRSGSNHRDSANIRRSFGDDFTPSMIPAVNDPVIILDTQKTVKRAQSLLVTNSFSTASESESLSSPQLNAAQMSRARSVAFLPSPSFYLPPTRPATEPPTSMKYLFPYVDVDVDTDNDECDSDGNNNAHCGDDDADGDDADDDDCDGDDDDDDDDGADGDDDIIVGAVEGDAEPDYEGAECDAYGVYGVYPTRREAALTEAATGYGVHNEIGLGIPKKHSFAASVLEPGAGAAGSESGSESESASEIDTDSFGMKDSKGNDLNVGLDGLPTIDMYGDQEGIMQPPLEGSPKPTHVSLQSTG